MTDGSSREIGKYSLIESHREKIKTLIRKEKPRGLQNDVELALEWIKKIMKVDNTLFYHLPEEERMAIFEQIASNTGITPYVLEKDWWDIQTLAIAFEMKTRKHNIFKGSTSLK